MSWSYSGDPCASDNDAVRFLVGDTDCDDPFVSDEEIAYAIKKAPSSLPLAAAFICDAIYSKFCRDADKKVGDLQQSASQIAQCYKQKAKDLRHDVGRNAEIFVGGQSRARNEALDRNDDNRDPIFRIGQDDHPGTLDDLEHESDKFHGH